MQSLPRQSPWVWQPLLPAPSEAELAEIRKAFDTVDMDKSGRLDRDEVKAAGQRLGRYLAASDVDEGMAEMDQNGDGTVDFDEFVSWWWRSGRLSALDKLEANWAAFSSRFDMVTSAALGSLGARGGGGSGGAATAAAAVVGAADA
eukprot:SAG22_NODE_384_length_11306_cov_12.130365_6_plen_146_part_00